MNCVWKDIPGYESLYRVSTDGRVMGLKRGKILSASSSGNYTAVLLSKDNQQKLFKVHALVALAFIGPRPDGAQVRHLDGDRKNNKLSNLAYGSLYENYMDSYRVGRFKHRPVSSADVALMLEAISKGKSSAEIAEKLKLSKQTVYRVLRKAKRAKEKESKRVAHY